MTKIYKTAEDVALHSDAMLAIEDAIKAFPASEQMVIVSGVLGNVLCRCGEKPSLMLATALSGTALGLIQDMIERTFDGTS